MFRTLIGTFISGPSGAHVWLACCKLAPKNSPVAWTNLAMDASANYSSIIELMWLHIAVPNRRQGGVAWTFISTVTLAQTPEDINCVSVVCRG